MGIGYSSFSILFLFYTLVCLLRVPASVSDQGYMISFGVCVGMYVCVCVCVFVCVCVCTII